ncbi:hypothetical protein ACFU5O_16075 [Streptomyces sp. NPDC057445]|uniref:hypothetical protein n=1 Tax=Streptomyces sp. NPDC057445 TaxID=3346136 RepID=UPI00369C0F03
MYTRLDGSWKTRLAPLVLVAGFVVWLTVVVVAISNEPPGGAPSVSALRSGVHETLRDQDADGLQRLFVSDTVGDGYAGTFIDHLRQAQPDGEVTTRLEEANGSRYLVLKGSSASGALCTAWPTVQKDGRWYLDGSPPVTSTPCNR